MYHIEQKPSEAADTSRPVSWEVLNMRQADDALTSRFAPVDLTTLQIYEEFR